MHIPTPDVPADPCGSADAPGPFDCCVGDTASPLGQMPCARPGGSPVPGITPLQPIIADPAEAAAIDEMRRLRTQLADLGFHATGLIHPASWRPGGTLPDVWDSMDDVQRECRYRAEEAMAARQNLLVQQIRTLENAHPLLNFTAILRSGSGKFCMSHKFKSA